MTSCGIAGPKLSGKTTLAKHLAAEYWRREKVRALVLDINADKWPEGCLTMSDEEKFWDIVWNAKGCLVIVDEASTVIQRDKELIPVFTRLRHRQHRLIVICHSAVDLLPQMRAQFDTLYLFRQSEKSAGIWAECFTQKELVAASELQQYEFIFAQLYKMPLRQKLAFPISA
jgi:phosphate starvation-inducible protein PhoH